MSDNTVFELLRACQRGEAGSIVGRELDSAPRLDPLYVPTQEDEELRDIFVDEYERDGKLVILTGSAGDGKSALLSKAYREAQRESVGLNKEDLHLDATGSAYLQRSYRHDLSDFLDTAIEGFHQEEASRKGLAINYGLAIDFFEQGHDASGGEYEELWETLKEAESERRVTSESGNIIVINLGHRDLFQIEPGHLGDGPLRELVDNFDASDSESPLQTLHDTDPSACPATGRCPLHHNLDRLTDDTIRDNLTRIVAGSSVLRAVYLNPRSILDQISRTLLHPEFRGLQSNGSSCAVGEAIVEGDVTPKSEHLLCNRVMNVFSGEEDGRFIDPVAQVSQEIDEQALSLESDESELKEATRLTPLRDDEWEQTDRIRTAIRLQYLRDELGSTHLDSETFKTFREGLKYFEGDDEYGPGGIEMKKTSANSLKNWSGRTSDGDRMAFIDGQRSPDYRFTAKWSGPDLKIGASREETKKITRPGQLRLYFTPESGDEAVVVPLGYRLYYLMTQINQGYNPSSGDIERSQGVRLLYSQLSQFTNKRESVRVEDRAGNPLFEVKSETLGAGESDTFELINVSEVN